jgi:hypothetical protein
MNYPVWDLFGLGGGFWIAFIAVVHVFVSHFAVGGGLWLVLAERKALKQNDEAFLAHVKGHSKFFLLLTMVFGGLTGVGIWWTIALLNPGGTSVLIHHFVFGWAAEWVCFLGEIVALFIYYYTFGKMRAREHQIIGWFYFVFAWLSLFLINGIIGFMLTPGGWLESHGFWQGFFNPSFWPSLFFRTFLSLMIAGMFGLITAVHRPNGAFRDKLVRYSAGWILAPFALMLLSAWWYVKALPEAQESMILYKASEIIPFMKAFLQLTPLLLAGALVMALRIPSAVRKPLAWAILLAGLLHMGSFEFIREAGRRPYVIHGHMYSNAILTAEVDLINEQGILKTARWTQFESITPENALQAGEEIFRIECSACHSRGGILNDILPLTERLTLAGMDSHLSGQGKVVQYMPPFLGTADERHALARYLVEGLHGKQDVRGTIATEEMVSEIPPFDAAGDQYVLLAWSTQGMSWQGGSNSSFAIQPPTGELGAQLILRGETPEVITEEVTLSFRPDDGAGPQGELHLMAERGIFTSPVKFRPALDGGRFDPYPLFTVEAKDGGTGEVLASTRTVLPATMPLGCGNCHGSEQPRTGVVDFSEDTSEAILVLHDKHSRTDLLPLARAGRPRDCSTCHGNPATGEEGLPGLLSLSAAIHGWHANYLTGLGAEACAFCHQADLDGQSMGLRGGHSPALDCTHCHGALEDHALGLLVYEQEQGKPGAERLIRNLEPRAAADLAQVPGRIPWLQEPDCLVCHEGFQRPDPATASAVHQWTEDQDGLFRSGSDESGMLTCLGCHGAPHATYPTYNDSFGQDRENIQPLQYQGNRRPIGAGGSCRVCHVIDMEDSIHHENMENP